MKGDVDDYLASEEEITHQWNGKISDGESTGTKGTLIATDRRVAYLAGGSFKDIDYSHIRSIESDTNEAPDVTLVDVLSGFSAFFGVTWIISSFIGGDVTALAMGLALVVLAFLLYHFQTHDKRESELLEKQSVTIVTGDGRENEINFETTEYIDADLSKTIREQA